MNSHRKIKQAVSLCKYFPMAQKMIEKTVESITNGYFPLWRPKSLAVNL